MNRLLASTAAALGLFALSSPAAAQARADHDSAACQAAAPVTTRHRIVLKGAPFDYAATAGVLAIPGAGDGEPRGCVFFVAYRHPTGPGRPPRPVSFIWNGGPGANSSYLHLEAFGPRRIVSPDDPTQPEPAAPALEDNQTTLLDQSDLVFVDAIGTGFSHATRPDYEAEFYNVRGDAAAFAQAVQAWRARFAARAAPLYLIGESYGVWRAAAVAERLEQAHDRVAGLVLISGGVPVGAVLTPEVKTALFIPNRTAAAQYFGKLPANLQADFVKATADATRWAETVYAPALSRADQLTSAERDTIIAGLARYTGLPAGKIDRTTLVVPRRLIQSELLADRKLKLGTLDVRVTRPDADSAARKALVEAYLTHDLGFASPSAYVFATGIGEHWGYNQADGPPTSGPTPAQAQAHPTAAAAWAAANDGPPGGSQPWLLRASALDPQLRILVVAGWYDSLNSCAGNDWLVAHLAEPVRRAITAICYRSGHMIYRDRAARVQLRHDLGDFYAAGARR